MLKYPCLVLDHDDTVVQSTPVVNYPSVARILRELLPGYEMTQAQFALYNFEPGFQALMDDIWCLTPTQQEYLYARWLEDVMHQIPPLYEGFAQLLARHREAGGKIVVVSHSCRENILRDYQAHFGFAPDLIFGWELPPAQRKPLPYPLLETMRQFSLAPTQLLMVDDLKPGCVMAQAAGVPFAGAGWSHDIPEIEAYLRRHGTHYFKTVDALERFLFG